MSIKDRALLVKMSRSAFGRSVRDSTAAEAVDKEFNADHAGLFYKKLFKGVKEISAIYSAANEEYTTHIKYTLPWLDGGFRLLPSAAYDVYIDEVGKKKQKRQEALDSLTQEKYGAIVQEDTQKMGGLADIRNYPPIDIFKSSFNCDVTMFPIPDSGDFRVQVSEEMKEKLDSVVRESEISGKEEIYRRVGEVLNRVVVQCSKPDGRIHESLLGNLEDLSSIIDLLNVHKDEDISIISEDLNNLANSVTTQQLRNSMERRKDLAKAANALINKIGGSSPVTSDNEVI